MNFAIHLVDLHVQFFEKFKEIMTPSGKIFVPEKLTYISILCRELDRFLLPNDKHGCAFHQPVVVGER